MEKERIECPQKRPDTKCQQRLVKWGIYCELCNIYEKLKRDGKKT